MFCSFFLIARGRYKGFETPRFRVLGCRVLVFQVDYHESVVSLDMSVLHSLLLLSSPFFASFSWCQTLQTSNEPHSPDLRWFRIPIRCKVGKSSHGKEGIAVVMGMDRMEFMSYMVPGTSEL